MSNTLSLCYFEKVINGRAHLLLDFLPLCSIRSTYFEQELSCSEHQCVLKTDKTGMEVFFQPMEKHQANPSL